MLLGIIAAFVLVAVNVLIWGNFTHVHFVGHTPSAGTTSRESRSSTSSHRRSAHSIPPHGGRGGKPQDKKAPPPKAIHVILTAARNDSWVQIRKGGPTGPVLFDGIVVNGQSIHVVGRRLWARFGALGNFDVSINGHPVHPSFDGTVDTFITASGIRAATAKIRPG